VLSGAVSNSDAKGLLDKINYDADVTWNQNTYFTRRDNVANLIVGVIMLAAIICGIAVVAGIAFGGFRVLMKRIFPDKVFDRPDQVEIIALHLSDPVRKPGDSA
jgi:predicted membrane protein